MTATDILNWAIETTLAVSVLTVIILLIRRPFARIFGARASYLLWAAPILRFIAPEFKVLPAPVASASTLSPEPMVVYYATAGTQPMSSQPVDITGVLPLIILIIWFGVAAIWLTRLAINHFRIASIAHRASMPAPANLDAMKSRIAKRLNSSASVILRLASNATGPCVIGLFRPIILLPNDFEQRFSVREQELALAHEIAHVSRSDAAATLAALVLRALQWPNPLAHIAYEKFRTDQEAACDSFVLNAYSRSSAVGEYASALLKASCSTAETRLVGLAMAHPVKERIMLLKNSQNEKSWPRILAAGLILFGTGATANYAYADHHEKDESMSEDHAGKKMKKHVIVMSGDDEEEFDFEMIDGDGDIEIIKDGDGEKRVIQIRKQSGDGEYAYKFENASCTANEGEPEPFKVEWSDERSEGDRKEVHKSVICLTGDDAKPENRAAALRKAIDDMEARAKAEEERRRRAIDGLRAKLREIEKEN